MKTSPAINNGIKQDQADEKNDLGATDDVFNSPILSDGKKVDE